MSSSEVGKLIRFWSEFASRMESVERVKYCPRQKFQSNLAFPHKWICCKNYVICKVLLCHGLRPFSFKCGVHVLGWSNECLHAEVFCWSFIGLQQTTKHSLTYLELPTHKGLFSPKITIYADVKEALNSNYCMRINSGIIYKYPRSQQKPQCFTDRSSAVH